MSSASSFRPLGRFELAQVLTSEAAPLNAVSVIRLAGAPRSSVLERALENSSRCLPLLRARIVRRNGETGFEVRAESTAPSLTCRPLEDDADLHRLVEHELARPFDVERESLVRFHLLESLEGDSAHLVTCFHHAIMDAVSGARFVERLLGSAAAIEAGTELEEPSAPTMPPPAEALYPAAYRGLGLGRRVASYLVQLAHDEIAYRLKTSGERRPSVDPEASNRILSFELDAETTRALSRRARRERLTVHSALAAALLRTVARRFYDGRERWLRHVYFADLRPYLDPPPAPDQLAAYLALVRITVAATPQGGFWELAGRIHEAIRTGLGRGDKYLSPYLAPAMVRALRHQTRERMAATAIAYHGKQELTAPLGEIRVLEHHTFVSNVPFGPEYTAQVRLAGGKLIWDVVYLDSDLDHREARAVGEEISEHLRGAI